MLANIVSPTPRLADVGETSLSHSVMVGMEVEAENSTPGNEKNSTLENIVSSSPRLVEVGETFSSQSVTVNIEVEAVNSTSRNEK